MTAAFIQSSPGAIHPPKRDRVIYWTATALVAGIMLWSAYNFCLNEKMRGAFAHLGLPNWFRVELTVAKALGALALIIPATPPRIKEFAYFGFAITLISASIAHLSSGDSIALELGHMTVFFALVVSYVYDRRARAPDPGT